MSLDMKAIALELREDPMFPHMTASDQIAEARRLLLNAGEDETRIAAMAGVLVRAALSGPPPARAAAPRPKTPAARSQTHERAKGANAKGDTTLGRFARATGYSDSEIGELLGISRVTVHAKRTGTNKGPLHYDQAARLKRVVVDRHVLLEALLDELSRIGA